MYTIKVSDHDYLQRGMLTTLKFNSTKIARCSTINIWESPVKSNLNKPATEVATKGTSGWEGMLPTWYTEFIQYFVFYSAM